MGRPQTTVAAQSAGASVLTPVDTPTDQPVDADRRWLIFAIVGIGLFMGSMDQTIVSTALPAIQRDLHAQLNWTGWTITVYILAQVLVLPVAGKFGDRFGRRRIFLSAIILFTVASLACGIANDIYVLVALRAVQAIGGGAIMPSAYGITASHFGKNRDRALGVMTSIFPIGGIVGPVVGGVIVTYWSWRGIFLVNLPIGIILIALTLRFVPESKPMAGSRVDLRGIALLGTLLLSAMFGIAWVGTGNTPFYSPIFIGCEVLAIAAGWAFIRHARRHENAVIPMSMLSGRGFATINTMNFLFGAGALGFGALVPFYAEKRYDLSSLSSGTLLTARAIGMISLSAVAALALRRTGYRLPIICGHVVVATGMVLLAIKVPDGSAYSWLTIAAAVTGLGIGITVPAANNASLQLAPDHVASISGLRGMFRQGGAIISVSISTAIVTRSGDPGLALSHLFIAFAVILIAVLPIVALIPEHKGNW